MPAYHQDKSLRGGPENPSRNLNAPENYSRERRSTEDRRQFEAPPPQSGRQRATSLAGGGYGRGSRPPIPPGLAPQLPNNFDFVPQNDGPLRQASRDPNMPASSPYRSFQSPPVGAEYPRQRTLPIRANAAPQSQRSIPAASLQPSGGQAVNNTPGNRVSLWTALDLPPLDFGSSSLMDELNTSSGDAPVNKPKSSVPSAEDFPVSWRPESSQPVNTPSRQPSHGLMESLENSSPSDSPLSPPSRPFQSTYPLRSSGSDPSLGGRPRIDSPSGGRGVEHELQQPRSNPNSRFEPSGMRDAEAGLRFYPPPMSSPPRTGGPQPQRGVERTGRDNNISSSPPRQRKVSYNTPGRPAIAHLAERDSQSSLRAPSKPFAIPAFADVNEHGTGPLHSGLPNAKTQETFPRMQNNPRLGPPSSAQELGLPPAGRPHPTRASTNDNLVTPATGFDPSMRNLSSFDIPRPSPKSAAPPTNDVRRAPPPSAPPTSHSFPQLSPPESGRKANREPLSSPPQGNVPYPAESMSRDGPRRMENPSSSRGPPTGPSSKQPHTVRRNEPPRQDLQGQNRIDHSQPPSQSQSQSRSHYHPQPEPQQRPQQHEFQTQASQSQQPQPQVPMRGPPQDPRYQSQVSSRGPPQQPRAVQPQPQTQPLPQPQPRAQPPSPPQPLSQPPRVQRRRDVSQEKQKPTQSRARSNTVGSKPPPLDTKATLREMQPQPIPEPLMNKDLRKSKSFQKPGVPPPLEFLNVPPPSPGAHRKGSPSGPPSPSLQSPPSPLVPTGQFATSGRTDLYRKSLAGLGLNHESEFPTWDLAPPSPNFASTSSGRASPSGSVGSTGSGNRKSKLVKKPPPHLLDAERDKQERSKIWNRKSSAPTTSQGISSQYVTARESPTISASPGPNTGQGTPGMASNSAFEDDSPDATASRSRRQSFSAKLPKILKKRKSEVGLREPSNGNGLRGPVGLVSMPSSPGAIGGFGELSMSPPPPPSAVPPTPPVPQIPVSRNEPGPRPILPRSQSSQNAGVVPSDSSHHDKKPSRPSELSALRPQKCDQESGKFGNREDAETHPHMGKVQSPSQLKASLPPKTTENRLPSVSSEQLDDSKSSRPPLRLDTATPQHPKLPFDPSERFLDSAVLAHSPADDPILSNFPPLSAPPTTLNNAISQQRDALVASNQRPAPSNIHPEQARKEREVTESPLDVSDDDISTSSEVEMSDAISQESADDNVRLAETRATTLETQKSLHSQHSNVPKEAPPSKHSAPEEPAKKKSSSAQGTFNPDLLSSKLAKLQQQTHAPAHAPVQAPTQTQTTQPSSQPPLSTKAPAWKTNAPRSLGNSAWDHPLLPQTDESVFRRAARQGSLPAQPLSPLVSDSVLTMTEAPDMFSIPIKKSPFPEGLPLPTSSGGLSTSVEPIKRNGQSTDTSPRISQDATRSRSRRPSEARERDPSGRRPSIGAESSSSSGHAIRNSPRPSSIPAIPSIPTSSDGHIPAQLHSQQETSLQRVYIGDQQRYCVIAIDRAKTAKSVLEEIKNRGELWVKEASAGGWALWEVCPELGLERPLRYAEPLLTVVRSWGDSKSNYLLVRHFVNAPLLARQSASSSVHYLAPVNYASRKGRWTKRWLSLRDHALYLSKNEQGDESFLCTLSNFDGYFMSPATARQIQTPKPFAFAIKSLDPTHIFENADRDYVHFFSVKTEEERDQWIKTILTSEAKNVSAKSLPLNAQRPSVSASAAAEDRVTMSSASSMMSRETSSTRPPLVDPARAQPFKQGSLLANSSQPIPMPDPKAISNGGSILPDQRMWNQMDPAARKEWLARATNERKQAGGTLLAFPTSEDGVVASGEGQRMHLSRSMPGRPPRHA